MKSLIPSKTASHSRSARRPPDRFVENVM